MILILCSNQNVKVIATNTKVNLGVILFFTLISLRKKEKKFKESKTKQTNKNLHSGKATSSDATGVLAPKSQ